MKHSLFLAVLVAALGFTATALAVDLKDSAHDLSSTNATAGVLHANEASSQLCAFCHTPHTANAGTYGPLWNRHYTPGAFTNYSSSTFQGGAIALGAQSYACLSCHDGTVALDNLANIPGSGGVAGDPNLAGYTWANAGAKLTAGKLDADSDAFLGTDLSNDHPVGFSYDTSDAADPGVQAKASLPAWVKLYGAGSNVECATCHDVHDYSGGGLGAGTFTMFLREDTAGSNICLDCHLK